MRDLPTLTRVTREFTVENPTKSWALLLSTFVGWGISVFGTTQGPWWCRSFFSVLAGLFVIRVFIFYHDYLHGAIFRNSKAAHYIMWWYGVLILNPPNVWKRSHNYHHQHNAQIATASIGSFPVMTVKQYGEAKPIEKLMYRLARNPITIFFGYFFIFILGMCLKSFIADPKRHYDSLVSLVLHVALLIGLTAAFGWQVMVLSFLTPLFIACALGGYLFYMQHNFPGVQLKPRQEWTYTFAALSSSSYMVGGPLVRYFTGNIGYHHVHHLNSQIPFYRLPEAMAAVPELQNPMRTSLMPWDIYKCLKLKLWDPDQNEMVGFPRKGHTLLTEFA